MPVSFSILLLLDAPHGSLAEIELSSEDMPVAARSHWLWIEERAVTELRALGTGNRHQGADHADLSSGCGADPLNRQHHEDDGSDHAHRGIQERQPENRLPDPQRVDLPDQEEMHDTENTCDARGQTHQAQRAQPGN